jgi:hypothetical protein
VRTVVVVDGVSRDLAGDATSVGDVATASTVEVFAVDDAGNRGLVAALAANQPTASPTGPALPGTATAAPSTAQARTGPALPATGGLPWGAPAVALLAAAAWVARRRSAV